MSVIELCLDPADTRCVIRLPTVQGLRRPTVLRMVWHDTPGRTLVAQGLGLSHARGVWRLERLRPASDRPGSHVAPSVPIEECSSPAAFGTQIPSEVVPIAMLLGRVRALSMRPTPDHPEIAVTLLEGELSGGITRTKLCRVRLEGPPAAVWDGARQLAQAARVTVPPRSIAASAVSDTQDAPTRHRDVPQIEPGQTVTDSAAFILGQLLDSLVHWSTSAGSGRTSHPVHQMRVATRRLRSALSILKPALLCPEVAPLGMAVRDAAMRLGAARDWDVFLEGTGTRIGEAFPEDRRVQALLAASRRRRNAAYDDLRTYLDGPDFRVLTISLGCVVALRPWETPDTMPALQQPISAFAASALSRRLKRVRQVGRDISGLPIPALHELRKDCKRLRYATDFFGGLFPDKPTRRFSKHLAALQEELGVLNDGAAASALMSQLGRAERGYAAGLVGGFVAASTGQNRARIEAAWKRFRQQSPFWVG